MKKKTCNYPVILDVQRRPTAAKYIGGRHNHDSSNSDPTNFIEISSDFAGLDVNSMVSLQD
jgi:hypothetical protein